MKLHAILATLLLAGCAQAATKAAPATKPAGTKPAGTKTEDPMSEASVQIAFAGKRAARPPMTTVLVDVRLRNPSDEPLWFVLPVQVGTTKAPEDGVMGVELFEAGGDGPRALFAKFVGNAGFQTIQVPAGGEVLAGNVPLSWWRPESAPTGVLPVEVLIARDIDVGGKPIDAWVGPTKPELATSFAIDLSKATRAGTNYTEDSGEVPVSFGNARRLVLDVPVP